MVNCASRNKSDIINRYHQSTFVRVWHHYHYLSLCRGKLLAVGRSNGIAPSFSSHLFLAIVQTPIGFPTDAAQDGVHHRILEFGKAPQDGPVIL